MSYDLDELLRVAKEAAVSGGDVLMRYWRDGVQMRNKSDSGGKAYDLVSDADIESEHAVAATLRAAFPSHELMGEENLVADADAEHLWIIDPLDGTNNYAHRVPHFAVSIAYYHLGRPVVGVVLNPVRQECYTAVRGGGAFLDGRPIVVSEIDTLSGALIGCGFYYDRGEMMRRTLRAIEALFEQQIHGIRRMGTASLDLCQVASGMFGGFLEYKLSPWDFAAGRLILEEAGGRISDADGGELPLQSTSVVASNGRLHDAILEISSKQN
ncbi:inositol monophosphatase family protein [Stieleria varia]|uniref:Inositol-1-monophosphatase n=1 Tax=Stieleria varia TaxID=2528005 RepID=A0A5C6ANQ7_9BACT|nr:inositol monophosphatase family protein [Stieleria varia]TWU01320.1 Inositol-1-monophosphatase [Stieleria varia]